MAHTHYVPLLEIPRRSAACAKGQETFAPGADYYSILTEGAQEEWQRRDFCQDCWEASGREESVKNGIGSYWKSKVPVKKETPPLSQNRNERILELLREGLSQNSEEDYAETFVLALYLARARVLYLRQELQREDGSRWNLYEVAATEEMLAVRKIGLSQLQVGKIQQHLAHKLAQIGTVIQQMRGKGVA